MAEENTVDNYRLGNLVATGSTSQIWEAVDEETNERFAMKLLLEEAFKKSEHKATLKREFKIASGFDHPNIIQVYGHRQSREHAYYIMEYFGGPNLKQIIRGDVSTIWARYRKMAECILMAMDNVHESGWLHRDIKPDNIMMTKATDVRLIDFSLSARIPSAVAKMISSKTKNIQGTRTYIAPELIRRKHPSIQSDLYSFGVTLYECITGRPPFMGSSPNDLLMKHIQETAALPSAFNENVTPEMDKFILRLMAKKPENRPETAAETLSELRGIKIFKEDPIEYAKKLAQREKDDLEVSVASKLDSRSDAERQQRIREGLEPAPQAVAPKPAEKPKSKPKPKQQAPQKPAAPPAQPTPQQMPPQPATPQQPMMPQPGFPQYPAMPGQMPGYPQQPPTHQPMVPQQPQQPQPQAPKPTPSKPAAAKTPPKKEPDINPEELPFADELPDIL